MGFFSLLACFAPSNIANIAGAHRLAELSNGELLVGTVGGELWLVSRFGDARLRAHVEGARELVTDPAGRYWVLTPDGTVLKGGLWVDPEPVAEGASLLVRTCEETLWLGAAARPGVNALDLAGACDAFIEGTEDGRVDGKVVSHSRITRVQVAGAGVLWVDEDGRTGCIHCALPAPATGVIDARVLHVAPFVKGEVAWIDREGGIWIAGG